MTSQAQAPLVLLTGGTGHLGFKTLLLALQSGYRVRAAVRSLARKDVVVNNPALKRLNVSNEQLSFVEVPDLAAPGAYDAAVKDVDYVIHVASPITTGGQLSSEEFEKYFILPAVQGTIGMLESVVAHGGNVKRVVITSSVVAIVTWSKFIGGFGPDEVLNADSRAPDPEGPYSDEFMAYSASKTAALNASERFMKEKQPNFDLVNIHPSFIEGRDELVLSASEAMKGTNAVVLAVVAGRKAEMPLPGATVHNDDVARVHVEALDTKKVPAGSYITHSNNPHGTLEGSHWDDINDIVARNFPEAIKKGLISNAGFQGHVSQRIDVEKTEKTFGWRFQGFEEQVKSVVGQYIELVEKEKAGSA